jgi:hypothetical protein
MAGVTGGRVVTNSNDMTQGMKEVAADLRGTYSIGFYAVDEPDGSWRRLDVKTKRRGVRFLHKQGYLAEAVTERPQGWAEEQWSAAVNNPLGSTGIRFDAACERRAEGGSTMLDLVLYIPADELHLREVDGQRQADAELAVAQKAATGLLDTRRQPVRFRLPLEQQRAPGPPILRYALGLTLKPETLTIRVIVRDRLAGRYGAIDIAVNRIP